MKLTNRIEVILQNIKKCKTLCDIGCDHGYVAFNALCRGICDNVILSDISEKSLDKAVKLFIDKNLDYKKYNVFGVRGIIEEFDMGIICGMGGHEIVDILKDIKPCNLVLQPMTDLKFVRLYLIENGYKITSDFIFKSENKFYNLITAEVGETIYSDLELEFGQNINDLNRDFIEYLNIKKDKIELILKGDLPNDVKLMHELQLENVKGILNDNC